MTNGPMSLERFEAIVAAYGARRESWPPAERSAAEALAAGSPAARALLDEATALDRLLDAVPAPVPAPGLRAAIIASRPHGPQRSWAAQAAAGLRAALAELGGYRVMGPVLAGSLVLGVLAGASMPADTIAAPDILQLSLMDGGFEEY